MIHANVVIKGFDTKPQITEARKGYDMNKEMVKVAFALAALVALLFFAGAQRAHGQELTASTKVLTSYVDVDAAVLHPKPVQQSEVLVAWKSGLYVDGWFSTGFDRERNFGKELDLTVGFGSKAGAVRYSLEAGYLALVGGDFATIAAEVALDKEFFAPYARAEFYTPTTPHVSGRGTLLYAGLRSDFKIAPRVKFSGEAVVIDDSGVYGFQQARLAQAYLGLKVAVTEKTTILGGVRKSYLLSHVSDGRAKGNVWEIGISRQF